MDLDPILNLERNPDVLCIQVLHPRTYSSSRYLKVTAFGSNVGTEPDLNKMRIQFSEPYFPDPDPTLKYMRIRIRNIGRVYVSMTLK